MQEREWGALASAPAMLWDWLSFSLRKWDMIESRCSQTQCDQQLGWWGQADALCMLLPQSTPCVESVSLLRAFLCLEAGGLPVHSAGAMLGPTELAGSGIFLKAEQTGQC